MHGVGCLMTPLGRSLGNDFRTTKLKFNLEERLYYFALSLKSYRDVKIIKGALPKLTIFGTVNGCEEKKEVLHTVYRTRKFED